jgi:hypothetical protein
VTKLLIVGNSQAGCIKRAYDRIPEVLNSVADVYFYVISGGTGPYFQIKSDRLVVEASNPKYPPYAIPEDARSLPLKNYDIIFVSALGYIDGGFAFVNQITRQGLLFDFGPKANPITDLLLSKSCYTRVIFDMLMAQSGFRFLESLRGAFGKRIVVQPFPLLSSLTRESSAWAMNQMYEQPLEAHKFFQGTRDEFVDLFCRERSIELLPYLRHEWTEDYFTPEALMRSGDCVHPTDEYGELVVRQLASRL